MSSKCRPIPAFVWRSKFCDGATRYCGATALMYCLHQMEDPKKAPSRTILCACGVVRWAHTLSMLTDHSRVPCFRHDQVRLLSLRLGLLCASPSARFCVPLVRVDDRSTAAKGNRCQSTNALSGRMMTQYFYANTYTKPWGILCIHSLSDGLSRTTAPRRTPDYEM